MLYLFGNLIVLPLLQLFECELLIEYTYPLHLII